MRRENEIEEETRERGVVRTPSSDSNDAAFVSTAPVERVQMRKPNAGVLKRSTSAVEPNAANFRSTH